MCSTEFVAEWFANPKWWFNASSVDDEYICKKYKHLLDNPIHEKNENTLTDVLIHDQLARHVSRCLFEGAEDRKSLIQRHLQVAIATTLKSVEKPAHFSWQEWTFLMLPYRHAHNMTMIANIIQYVWEVLEGLPDADSKILKRFLKATYMHINDKAYGIEFYENDIPNKINIKNPFTNIQVSKDRFLISLSGGVDSMVCSSIFNDNRCIGAVFINYNNRPESPQELVFVKDWCTKIGLPLWVKTVVEINRPLCMKHHLRELYEVYTKQVRFACYKAAWDWFPSPPNVALQYVPYTPVVVMGHHQGDQIENCFTNILVGTKMNDLLGMDGERLVDGVSLVRPLLPIDKKRIMEFADSHNIPHLPDSTVIWCARGKIRDNVLPGIDKWCGIDTMAAALVKHAQMCCESQALIGMFAQTFKDKMLNRVPSTLCTIPESHMFFRKLFELYKLYPSNKALDELVHVIKRLKKINWDSLSCRDPKKHRRIELMKNVKIEITKTDAGILMSVI